MTRSIYVDRLVRLTLDISAVMDLLPHAASLGADEKIRAQGRMLALKTALDHAAGEQGDDPYAEEFRAAALEALSRIDSLAWDSQNLTGAGTARCTRPGRLWSGT
jgi:hypothetical protein